MKSVLKKAALPVAVIAVASSIMMLGGTAQAQEGKGDAPAAPETQTAPAQQSPPAPQPPAQPGPQGAQAPGGAYTFVAKEGDSLSLFARKSVQLYDAERTDIELSEAEKIAAETRIVQALGGGMLEIGQNVGIERKLVEDQANAARQLSPQQKTQWEAYAQATQFDIPEVTPATTPPPAQPPANQANPQPEGENQTQEGENQDQAEEQAEGQTQNQNDGAPWYWWLVGAGTLGVLYYLLSGSRRPRENK